jgi:surfeit locus 1 family protein
MNNRIRYKVKFEKIPSFVYLCVFPLLLALGFWQLHRAEEKRLFVDTQAQAVTAEALHLSATSEDNADLFRYRKVETTGKYDVSHQFLIDNRINGGKAGYFVMTPFLLQGENKAVLVNRGWVPLNRDRSILPDIGFDNTHGVVKGRINRFPSVGVKLPGADLPTDGWPSVVQVVDSDILAKRLGYPLFHFQIELDKEFPDGFKRDWQTINFMPPEQHTAYAVQWFGLAVTLTLLFIGYSLKKNDD